MSSNHILTADDLVQGRWYAVLHSNRRSEWVLTQGLYWYSDDGGKHYSEPRHYFHCWDPLMDGSPGYSTACHLSSQIEQMVALLDYSGLTIPDVMPTGKWVTPTMIENLANS